MATEVVELPTQTTSVWKSFKDDSLTCVRTNIPNHEDNRHPKLFVPCSSLVPCGPLDGRESEVEQSQGGLSFTVPLRHLDSSPCTDRKTNFVKRKDINFIDTGDRTLLQGMERHRSQLRQILESRSVPGVYGHKRGSVLGISNQNIYPQSN